MAPTDYRARDYAESTMEQVSETAQAAGRRAVSLTDDIADAIRERPFTALAIAAGLAFAWMRGPRLVRAPGSPG